MPLKRNDRIELKTDGTEPKSQSQAFTPHQHLRVSMRECPPGLVAREVLLYLMEQPDTVSSPLRFLQHQHAALLEEALAAVSTAEGGRSVDLSAIAAAQIDSLELHEKYVQVSELLLEKEEKILQLQRRTMQLEKNAAIVQRCLSNEDGGDFSDVSALSDRRKSVGLEEGLAASKPHRSQVAAEELQELNLKLSEYIDTLEHNIAMGFHFSDAHLQKTILELNQEKEDLLQRNMELAECFFRLANEKAHVLEQYDQQRAYNKQLLMKVDTLEMEQLSLKNELGRVKKLYQEKAMAAI
jgi:hypothetical protein